MDAADFMKMALDLAEKGQGFVSPNPMVGAVVVKDGTVVGRGYHESVGKSHAEVNAIDMAGARAKGATLYVTLEPCHHTGRTPPCTQKILAAGIKRVVMAMTDPNPDVTGGGGQYLRENGIIVETGICGETARRQNEVFIKFVGTRRPFVTIKCAATLDGRIATRTGDSKWVSGEESRKYVHRLRHAVDAILVGAGTVIKDDPRLTTRLDKGVGVDPLRLVLDTKLSIPKNAALLKLESKADTAIVVGPAVSDDEIATFKKNGTRMIKMPLGDDGIDLKALMDHLGNSAITSVLIEGGSRVIASAFKSGVVDKILFFFAPKILGGDDGVPICRGPGPEKMRASLPIKNISVLRFGDDILVEGYLEPAEGKNG